MLYDDYESYLTKYRKEYGENTIVLMQCGSFYELYDDGSKQTDLRMIGELLNIQVSRRNKSILEVSRNNLEMAGFPSYTLNKFLNILVSNNFTCVIVSQTTAPPNPKREVTDIVSPGTYIEDDIKVDSNFLMSVFIEEFSEYKTNKSSIVVGASLVDLSTGKTYSFECASKTNDVYYPLDELYRIIVTYNPREVTLCCKGKTIDMNSVLSFNKLITYLDLEGKCVHNDYDKATSELFKPSYQEEVLGKVYGSTGIISKVEFLCLDMMPCALVSFIRLLQFVHNHNENVLKKINPPTILEASHSLVLSYNSVRQLDVVPRSAGSSLGSRGGSSLLELLNNCKTSLGKRFFKEKLLNPCNDVDMLRTSYNNIEQLLNAHKESKVLDVLRSYLVEIYDLERLFRKIDLNTVQPFEIGYIVVSLNSLCKICQELTKQNINLSISDTSIIQVEIIAKNLLHEIAMVLNEEELLKHNFDNISPVIFNRGQCPTLDELYDEMNASKEYVYDIATKFNKLATIDNTFKVESNERDGYYLLTTGKRYQEFVKMNCDATITTLLKTKCSVKEFDSKAVSHSSSNLKVTHKSFRTVSDKIEIIANKLKRMCMEQFKMVLKDLSETATQYALDIVRAVSLIDFYWCCAFNAFTKKYSKPIVFDKQCSRSFLRAKALRHPIIETLNTNVTYISNDVSLGIETESCDGILLYGLNSSGKSSLMKSIGIAVLMAQAGMYVACGSFEYQPYDYIFTRIFSSDDIFKGQSTFTKEMMELRGIIQRANQNSLVLGDELCSGTESISALSIVSAGIHTLSKRHSSFIFATHLHDLISIPLITQLTNVKTFHLSVEYDEARKLLIYDRKLKAGNGSSLYGLEVCKSIGLDKDFLEIANGVRQDILRVQRNIVSVNGNSNKYNKGIYMDKCQVCGDKAKEVHHINEQRHADEDGYIDGTYHKNNKFNLVCLCESCHDDVHNKNLTIDGYKQTSDGVVLDFHHINRNMHVDNSHSKDEQVVHTMIEALLKDNNTMKKKDILLAIKQRFGNMPLTDYKISKILHQIKSK